MKKMVISLTDRMRNFENISSFHLLPKTPAISRISGRSFSNYTKQHFIDKPFSDILDMVFKKAAIHVCKEIQGADFAYHQADEVTILMKDYNNIKQEHYYAGNIQKISSAISSMFTYHFNDFMNHTLIENGMDVVAKPAYFECNTFSIPQYEVNNYFVLRQRNAIKNSVSRYFAAFFPKQEPLIMTTDEKIDMILSSQFPPWNSLPLSYQRGTAFKRLEVEIVSELTESELEYFISEEKEIPDTIVRKKWALDTKTPLFADEPNYINDIVFSPQNKIYDTKRISEGNEKDIA